MEQYKVMKYYALELINIKSLMFANENSDDWNFFKVPIVMVKKQARDHKSNSKYIKSFLYDLYLYNMP